MIGPLNCLAKRVGHVIFNPLSGEVSQFWARRKGSQIFEPQLFQLLLRPPTPGTYWPVPQCHLLKIGNVLVLMFLGSPYTLSYFNFSLCIGRNGRMPNLVAANTNRVRRINNPTIPSVDQAICMYENAGGSITRESSFGTNPLRDNAALTTRREELFLQNNSSFEDIFSNLVNGNSSHIERAILSFVDITRHLSITI